MKKRDSFKEFILDQLNGLERVSCKGMFGGFGLYSGDVFFGIIFKERLYFKTNSKTRSQYIEKGMNSFRPNTKQTLRTYYEVPDEMIEDPDQLASWAQDAIKSQP